MTEFTQQALDLKTKGNQLLATQKFDEALTYYEQALDLLESHKLAPEQQALLYCNISTVYFAKQDYDKALDAAQSGLQNDPSCAPCILRKFNALWKKEQYLVAVIMIHDFLNNYPEKQAALAPILNNFANSKTWYMHPKLRIVKLEENNYCVQAIDEVEEKEVLVRDNVIFPYSISSNDQIPTVFAHLLEHIELYTNRFKGLHPRNTNAVPQEYFSTWYDVIEGMVPSEIQSQREFIEELTRLVLVVKLNGFAGVYALACMFNHSCEENAEKIDNEIISTRRIKKGEFVNLNYIGYEDGVLNRRNILEGQFSFVCTCDRCLRELQPGSLSDSFKCSNCSLGKIYCPLLTEEPMQLTENQQATCSNCSTSVSVEALLQQYKDYRSCVEEAAVMERSSFADILDSLKPFLVPDCILDENHHLYLSALPLLLETSRLFFNHACDDLENAGILHEKSHPQLQSLVQVLQENQILSRMQQLLNLQAKRYGEESEEFSKTSKFVTELRRFFSSKA